MTGSDGETVVLKIPKLKKRDIRPGDMSDARKDGLSMERLQASPYVLGIYGFCGLSQVIEVGDAGGNIHDLIKTTRLRGSETISSIDKLKIAYQIVSAVSDMHSFEKDGLVSLVHNDICCHQFILSHGVYKLNDFHLSQFQKKNKHTNEVCNSHNAYSRWVSHILYLLVSTFQYHMLTLIFLGVCIVQIGAFSRRSCVFFKDVKPI